MNTMKVHIVLFVLLLALFAAGATEVVSGQTTDDRDGSFTTDKGTRVLVETSLSNEGGSPPQLLLNTEYMLTITITLSELGNDTLDIHDLEFEISISTQSLLGSGKLIFSSYYFDASTELIEENQTKGYHFPIFITGELGETTTNLDILFKMRENVENTVDPSTEFEGIGYEILISPGASISGFAFDGVDSDERAQEVFTDEGSNVRILANLSHDGEFDGKPAITSGNFYLLTVNFTLIELGTDPVDIHDLEVNIILEDSSISDLIPGKDPVKYFSAYGEDTSELTGGDSRVFEFALQPNTNINDTEVQLKLNFKFVEDIPNSFDKTSEYDLTFETQLNRDLENSGFDSEEERTPFPIGSSFFLSIFAIPLIRRKNH